MSSIFSTLTKKTHTCVAIWRLRDSHSNTPCWRLSSTVKLSLRNTHFWQGNGMRTKMLTENIGYAWLLAIKSCFVFVRLIQWKYHYEMLNVYMTWLQFVLSFYLSPEQILGIQEQIRENIQLGQFWLWQFSEEWLCFYAMERALPGEYEICNWKSIGFRFSYRPPNFANKFKWKLNDFKKQQ